MELEGKLHLTLLISAIALIIWSVIRPASVMVWGLEVVPAIVLLIAVVFVYPKFKFSNLTYILLWINIVTMTIGGHYDYSKVPLFNWIKDYFNLSRNHYDRVGHFFQGVLTAMLIKEILVKKKVVVNKKWVDFLVIATCLAISASYEIIEFLVAFISSSGQLNEEFLGMQGDMWDSQWDMICALSGAITSLILFRKHKI